MIKKGSFKLFNGNSTEDLTSLKKSRRVSASFTKSSSTDYLTNSPHGAHLTMSSLAKSSSYSVYPNGSGGTSKTMQFEAKKPRVLRRRESIDFSDIIKKHDTPSPDDDVFGKHKNNKQYNNKNRRPSEEMRRRLHRSRTLPCISSWDMYGDDSVIVLFHKRTSISNFGDQFRGIGSPTEERKAPRETIRKEDSIYEVAPDTKHSVISATKEKLLRLLVDPRSDTEYLHQYLETHMWHITSEDLFAKLLALYSPNITSEEMCTTRQRVIGVVVHWLEFFPKDFESTLKDSLITFIDVIAKTDMSATELLDAVAGNRKSSVDAGCPSSPVKSAKIPKKPGGEAGKFQFLDFHPTEVARQMTLIEHAKLCEIGRHEFLRQVWNKADGETRAPNLVAYIKRFNQVSYWVATEIVFTPNLKQRISVVKKMIQVAGKCVAFNNFNTAMEIVAGLNLSSVQRLKKTWKGLSSKYTTLFTDITKLLASENNYRHYRTVLSRAEPPVTPYLGVCLRDLTFIEDGNKDFVEDSQFLNFEKLRMISSVLSLVSKYQRVRYNFETVPIIRDYLQDAMFLDDAALHKYSQLCEPPTGATATASNMTTSTGFIGKSKRNSASIFTY